LPFSKALLLSFKTQLIALKAWLRYFKTLLDISGASTVGVRRKRRILEEPQQAQGPQSEASPVSKRFAVETGDGEEGAHLGGLEVNWKSEKTSHRHLVGAVTAPRGIVFCRRESTIREAASTC
jgi:hypothetical protein